MNALLLSAGPGERLRPLTLGTAKCLLPVLLNDKSLLEYWIRMMLRYGIEKVYINTFWLKEKFQDFKASLKKNIGNRIELFEEDSLYPVGRVLNELQGKLGDGFLVVNSDTYIEEGHIYNFINRVKYTNLSLIIGVSFHENVFGKSFVMMGSNDKVWNFVEKPQINKPGFSYAGILHMWSDLLGSIEDINNKELTKDLFPVWIDRMFTFYVGPVVDIGGSLEEYEKSREKLKEVTWHV